MGLLLSSFSLLSQESSEAMKVTYELTTFTNYNVDEEFKTSMSLFDKIGLSPKVEKGTYEELFYQNGQVEKTILHYYPNGMPEKWQKIPTKTVITLEEASVYAGNEIITTTDLPSVELVPANESAPFYLGTSHWNFPLNEEIILNLIQEGFEIVRNDAKGILIKNDEMSIQKDKTFKIEEYTQFKNGEKIASQTYSFKKDANGYFIYDYVVYRTIDCDDPRIPCIEQVICEKYENIVRDFIDPSLEPSVENGYGNTQEVIYPSITATQLGNMEIIQVDFSDDCPDDLIINVNDLQGNQKLTNVAVSRTNNSFVVQNMNLGVHTIVVQNHTVLPCSFMYIP